MGIEPTKPAWEAGVLPLNYTCMARIKPGLSDMVYFILFCLYCQGVALFLFSKGGGRAIFSGVCGRGGRYPSHGAGCAGAGRTCPRPAGLLKDCFYPGNVHAKAVQGHGQHAVSGGLQVVRFPVVQHQVGLALMLKHPGGLPAEGLPCPGPGAGVVNQLPSAADMGRHRIQRAVGVPAGAAGGYAVI